jgi:hypothetical protein
MTLLTNEIHVSSDLQHSVIIFAADRRISFLKKFHSLGKKIFPIEYLNAGIGFFGLAEVWPSGRKQSMSSWLAQFVTNHHDVRSLRDFADALRAELDRIVPDNIKLSNASGFHLAGFNDQNYPEFWFIRNIGGMNGLLYANLRNHYFVSEDFLARDARAHGYNGVVPQVSQPFARIYRNGDIVAHILAWDKFDDIFKDLFSLPQFKKLRTLSDYEQYVEFKMTLIARIYKRYCNVSSIGSPVDVFSLGPR